jgi:WD40 repeat protein
LLTASYDGSICLWNTEQLTEASVPLVKYEDIHTQSVNEMAVSSCDSNIFASGSSDSTSCVCDVRCKLPV